MKKFFYVMMVLAVLGFTLGNVGCATTGGQQKLSVWQSDCRDRVERCGRHGLEYTGGMEGGGGYDIMAYCADGEALLSLETENGYQFVQLPNQWLHGEPNVDTRFYFDASKRLVITVEKGIFKKDVYDMASRQWRPFERAGAQATEDSLKGYELIGQLRHRHS